MESQNSGSYFESIFCSMGKKVEYNHSSIHNLLVKKKKSEKKMNMFSFLEKDSTG